MTKFEVENWICNLQNAAAAVAAHLGEEAVKHVLNKYGADSIEGLAPCYYSEAFDELDFMASDAYD